MIPAQGSECQRGDDYIASAYKRLVLGFGHFISFTEGARLMLDSDIGLLLLVLLSVDVSMAMIIMEVRLQ